MHDKKVSGFRNIHAEVRNALINIGIRLKQRYKFILKKCLIIFVCLFIAFWSGVVVQLVQDWKEFKSPYPIMVEYYRIRYFGSYRSWMINYGCSENNILFKLLENQQKEDLEYIKSLIPKDDLLIDLLEWQIKFEPYFMHTPHDTHSKIDGLIDWLMNIRFKKSHIRQMTDQFKFKYFGKGIKIGIINGECKGIDSLNACEKFAKSILPAIKRENYFAKTVLQSLFVAITQTKIAMNNKGWEVYTEKTCTNLYYPVLIKQIHEWSGYIEKLSGLTARERRVIKQYIKMHNSDAKEMYEFNKKDCLKK
jgi:hypothetical protein